MRMNSMRKGAVLFLLLISGTLTVYAGKLNRDSLLKRLPSEKADSAKARLYNILAGDDEGNNNLARADSFAQLAVKYSQQGNYKLGLAIAYHTLGFIYEDKGDYPIELGYLTKSLKTYRELGDTAKIARLTSNVGNAYFYEGDYPKALDNYLQALPIISRLKDTTSLALLYGNIANVYSNETDYKGALENYNKALTIYEHIKDTLGLARNTANIGHTYIFMGKSEDAKPYFLKALQLSYAIKRKRGVEINLENLGDIFVSEKNYDSALVYFNKALNIARELEDKRAIAVNMGYIGNIYIGQKRYAEAEPYLLQALSIDTLIKRYERIKNISDYLSTLYSQTGQYEKAYKMYQLYTAAKDSLVSADKSKEIGKLEAKADYDKQLALQQADADKQTALQAAESKRQQITILFVGAIALAVAIMAIVVFRSLKVTRKQKALIEQQKVIVEEQKSLVENQKAIVEEKNKDITDSINYASRIQQALLTSNDYIGQYLKDYFILFKPRDIVSGDFYWAVEGPASFLICAGDCTGHGVPGAFMSLLNISMLNEATLEKKIYSPEKILDDIRAHIIKALNPEGSDKARQDGMDCILASLHPLEAGTISLSYAAAHNAPIIIRDGVATDMPTDKMPVGISPNEEKNFNLHTAELKKGDCLYLFTDGYADQFGGPKGKKFKHKKLQEKLLAISEQPMEEQKKMLEQTFNDWKGDLEQVDDVLIIGIRL